MSELGLSWVGNPKSKLGLSWVCVGPELGLSWPDILSWVWVGLYVLCFNHRVE